MLSHIQAAGIIRNLAKCTVKSKVEDIAFLLYDLSLSIVLRNLPWRLYTESSLEIGLWRREIPQHENTCPWSDRNACRQLSAGKRDSLRLQRIIHRITDRSKSRYTNARLRTGTDIDLVIMIKSILLLC